MEDKNPRLGEERIGGRGDDYITGREGTGETRTGSSTPGTRDFTTSRGDDMDPDRRTREIRKEIEQTREDMSETVEAIQDRLNPRNIAANAVDSVRTTASEKAREISDSESAHYVRANPIPTAMVGIGIAGLAWLAFGGRDASESRRRSFERNARGGRRGAGYYEVDDYRGTGRARTERFEHDAAGSYSPGMSYDTDRGSSWTGDATSRASEMASDVSRRARETTYRTRNQLQRTWNDSPMLVGAAAAVLGAIVGMAVPESERENELMGETRDNVIEGVQQTVREKVEKVQEAASNVVGQVQNAVGLAGDESSKQENRTSGSQPAKPGATDLGRS